MRAKLERMPFALQTVLALLVVVGAAWGLWCISGGRGPDFANSLSSVATLGAFMAAVVAARYAARVYTIEERRDDHRAEEARRAQASQVAVWTGPHGEAVNASNGKKANVWSAPGFIARNVSDLPVTNLEVNMRFGADELGEQKVDVLPPSQAPLFHPFPPDIVDRMMSLDAANEALGQRPLTLSMEVSFTDSAGVRWRRSAAGNLFSLDS